MVKILLVEDNPLNQDMLSRRLARQGYQVVAATDGAVALSMAKSEKPDLILMDMNIPIIDGWEATRRLKADDLTQPIPVIALTAHAMVGDREKALAAGCDDYATKPVEFKPLLKLIRAFTAAAATAEAGADLASEDRSRVNRAPLVEPFSSAPSSAPGSAPSSAPAGGQPSQFLLANQPAAVESKSASSSRSPALDDAQPSQSENPFTLLLVNDNAVNREILHSHLQRKGYSVIEADKPSTATAILNDFSIDLVLLDITVPETANLALLQQLRSQYSKQALPVMIVSSHSSDEEIVQAFELGVNDYATKPINLAIIMARIQSQLETLLAARQTPLASVSHASSSAFEDAKLKNTELESTGLKPRQETPSSEPSTLENPSLGQNKPIVTGALELTSRDLTSQELNTAIQGTAIQDSAVQDSATQKTIDQVRSQPADMNQSVMNQSAKNSVGFRDKSYPVNHIFSKTPFSQVQLVENPSALDHSLCLSETFFSNIQDEAVLEDFRSVVAIERSQLQEIAKHDRIADLLSFFKRDNSFGWLQAYTEGLPLSEILSAKGNTSSGHSNVSPPAVLQAMQEMLEALIPFHTKRVVHSSMQPQHLWRCANTGSLRLINLGLSQRLAVYLAERSPQHHKGFSQEHRYMPIEQRIGQPELSSDVYAVGLISLQLLTGKTPSVLTNVLLSSDSFSQRLPSVPAAMIDLFAKMLAQDSQERYSSAMEALKGVSAVSL